MLYLILLSGHAAVMSAHLRTDDERTLVRQWTIGSLLAALICWDL